jgi:hypothetical protein
MFSDDVLDALGAWQRGWQADDARKKPITDDLLCVAAKLPDRFRSAPQVCFRKRFLFPKDLEPLVMFSGLDDGVASWTTDRDFAMDFKGLLKPGAPTAVFFAHRPDPSEVIVNFASLWADADFQAAAEDYRVRDGREVAALFNFADRQAEVVLHARLHQHEVEGMVGASGSFDDICAEAGVVEESAKDRLFAELTDKNIFLESPHWISGERARRVIERTRRRYLERNAGTIGFAAAARLLRPKWLGTVSRLPFGR